MLFYWWIKRKVLGVGVLFFFLGLEELVIYIIIIYNLNIDFSLLYENFLNKLNFKVFLGKVYIDFLCVLGILFWIFL